MGILDRFLNIFTRSKEEDELLNKIKELENKIESASVFSDIAPTQTTTSETEIAAALIDFLDSLKQHQEEIFKNSISNLPLSEPHIHTYTSEQLYSSLKSNPVSHLFKELFKSVYDIDPEQLTTSSYKKVIENLVNQIQQILPNTHRRAETYKLMYQIYHSFPIAKRIVNEYLKSLFQDDLSTGDYIRYRKQKEPKEYISEPVYNEIVDEIERIYNLIRKFINDREFLRTKVLPKVAVKGDAYVEVINKKDFLLKNYFKIGYIQKTGDNNDSVEKIKDLIVESDILEETEQELQFHLSFTTSKITSILSKISEQKFISPKNISLLLESTVDYISKNLVEVELPSLTPIVMETVRNQIQTAAPLLEENSHQTILLEIKEEKTNNSKSEKNNNDNKGKKDKNNFEDYIREYLNDIRKFNYKSLSQKIEIKIHDPEYVIPISDGNKIFGYFVINPVYSTGFNNITSSNLITKLGQIFDKLSHQKYEDAKITSQKVYLKLIEYFYNNVSTALHTYLNKLEQQYLSVTQQEQDVFNQYQTLLKKALEIFQTSEEVKERFFAVLQDIIFEKTLSRIKVRFVFPEDIVHFYFQIDEYPYGESILSPVALHSTLYMVSVYSNILYRLTRTPLYTKYQIDAGALQNWETKVREIASKLRTQTFTLDDLGSLTKINRYLTDFKFMFEVLKDGKTMLSQTMEQMGNPQIRIQDIQDYKQDIAMLSNIPSMRLGFVDGAQIRERIVDANIQWAEMITDIQRNVENSLNKLFNLIIRKTLEKNLLIPSYTFVKIEMNKPISLSLLQLQNVVTAAAGIIGTIAQIPNLSNQINYTKLLKELMPGFDWDKFLISDNQKESELKSIGQQNKQQTNNQGTDTGSGAFNF